ncbi:MAG: beta-ketoacyl synthase chain length factor, partial [Epsilonproteobacteria bacterium]|nr:beta-ketoacyl synthase chain length factor [Campylobacterota bacterium]
DGRIVYGSSFGELSATANILNSINLKEPMSPTHFQNSVYNTAVSYLSILSENTNEIITVSSGDYTSLNILKSGAIKALDGDTLLLIATETLNIDKIEEVNQCIDFLECGVALKVRMTKEEATLCFDAKNDDIKTPKSLSHMLNIARNTQANKPNIIKVTL